MQDPGNPFNDNARPNSWTPPLNTTWRWGIDRVYGVNLGGLFVLEPFITPAIFQRYPTAVDEYTLSLAMAADTANGGLKQLEDHYNTFIVRAPTYIRSWPTNTLARRQTEQDIAAIAGACCASFPFRPSQRRLSANPVLLRRCGAELGPHSHRLLGPRDMGGRAVPRQHVMEVRHFSAVACAVETGVTRVPLSKIHRYFLRVLTWARKYGLRVSLDLHAVPGSQNGAPQQECKLL